MTARSSAMVLAALTLRMNCFTEVWPLMVSFQCSSAILAVLTAGLGDQLFDCTVRREVLALRMTIVTWWDLDVLTYGKSLWKGKTAPASWPFAVCRLPFTVYP